MAPDNPLLSSRNFDLGTTFPYNDENICAESGQNVTVENEGAFDVKICDSVDFSVK